MATYETPGQAADRLTRQLDKPDWTPSRAHIESARNALLDAATEMERMRKELDYAYRCISGGFNQGVFDFSVLKDVALDYVKRAAR